MSEQLFRTNRVEFTQLAAEYKVVNLGQGFPDFSPPPFIQEAFCKAVSGGPTMHQYTRAFVSAIRHVCLLRACRPCLRWNDFRHLGDKLIQINQ